MAAEAKFIISAQDKTNAAMQSAKKNFYIGEKAVDAFGAKVVQLASITALVVLAKKIGDFGVACVKEFAVAERAQLRLQAALGDGRQYDKANNLIDRLGKSYNGSKDDIEGVVSALSALGKNTDQIEAITRASVNLANTTGQDLNSSYLLLADTFEGKVSAKLQKLIPELGTLTKEQLAAGGATTLINEKLQAMSDKLSQGTAQKITNLSESFGDLAENIGQNMAPVFNPFLDWLDSVVSKSNDAFEALDKLKTAREKVSGGAVLGTQDKISLVQDRVTKLNTQKTALEINSKFDVGVKLQLALWNKLHGEDLASSEKQLALLIQQQAIENKIATLTEEAAKEAKKAGSGKSAADIPPVPTAVSGAPSYSYPSGDAAGVATYPESGSTDLLSENRKNMPTRSGLKPDSGGSFNPFDGMGKIGDVITKVVGGLDSFLGWIGSAVGALSSVKLILDPFGVILMGIMDVLTPIINSLLTPLIGILRVFGQLIGMFIAPLLNMLLPVISLITKGFIFLYNYALVPVQNFFIDLIELIGNAFIFLINGLIKAINKIPGVDIKKINKLDMDNQKASKINMDDIMTAGSNTISTADAQSSTGSSASYTGKTTINFYYYQQAPIYGSGGIKELAANLKEVYDANLALGM